jgi:ribose transport system ATP-binding protein
LANTEYALRAEGIGKSFGRVEALKAASLWGEAGKVTTLLGRNGAGKTTLMKIAAGVLRPDYGVVSLFGDVRENHSLPRLARSGLMYVPQDQLVSPRYRVRDHLHDVPPDVVPLPMLGFEASAVQEVGAF